MDDVVSLIQNIAIALAGVSIAGIGLIMAGYFFWPDLVQRYKREIPTVIVGLIIVFSASFLVGFFQ